MGGDDRRILLAEDDPVIRQLLLKFLELWGYQVTVACDGVEACRLLGSEDPPKLALLDWKMPGMAGVEVCRRIRAQRSEPYIYMILLTAHHRDEDIVAGLEAGADDYITKPFQKNELRVRLRAGQRIIKMHDELAAARQFYQEKASRDALTGLSNREEVLDCLQRELARCQRDGQCVSVIMADLDHFKKINDTYGHLAGDVVLRMTAQRMRSMVRPHDGIGRYGGEEFLLFLPGCSLRYAGDFANRLRIGISCEGMETPEGVIPVTVSLGVTATDSLHNWDEVALIKAADAALYRAKQKGRNRVETSAECLAAA
ncbi:diguanylate cyclase [Geomonas sp.]|uniref:GGDEF domain-containing protein n=1 Tax=Geomonas sp. TaxID=2651584 RepID=UPI002B482D75|nr:diguanylate cyclase [Geomonas sp.]HJV36247.1 diguanylate cyclase [Geomonas sp.]